MALRAGALTADAVALEARKAAETDDSAVVPAPGPATPAAAATVTSLTQRRLARLPPRRPLRSVAHYDQLLRRHPPTSQGPTSQEEAR